MTVETTTRKAIFAGGQSALTFSFRTLVSNPEYIFVDVVNLSDGTSVTLNYPSQYSVSVNANGVGGLVTINPTFSTGYNYVVYRVTTPLQASAYSDYNQFPAETLENNLDQLTMVSQEQEEDNSRTLTYPISSSSASTILPTPVANSFLQWNSTGTALINATIPDPSTLVKATNSDAMGGVEDTHYTTAAKVLLELQTFVNTLVTSSTTDVTIVTMGSLVVIQSINAATSGANKILRLDGTGKIPPLNGSQLTNLPYYPFVKVSNTQSSGTSGGSLTSGSWTNLIINSIDTDTSSIVSVSSNLITLPAGTYLVDAVIPCNKCDEYITRLFNSTDSVQLLPGTSATSPDSGTGFDKSYIKGIITLVSSKSLSFQYNVTTSHSTDGQGIASNLGTEVYAVATFTKIS